jgi:hypothetical protein
MMEGEAWLTTRGLPEVHIVVAVLELMPCHCLDQTIIRLVESLLHKHNNITVVFHDILVTPKQRLPRGNMPSASQQGYPAQRHKIPTYWRVQWHVGIHPRLERLSC